MNEKRFTITKEFKAIHDEDGTTITYCDYLSDGEQLVDLLNDLNDKLQQTKKLYKKCLLDKQKIKKEYVRLQVKMELKE